MNGSELLLTLNAVGRLLVRGEVDRVATYFDCPLPVYLGDRFVLLHCRRKIAAILAVFHASACRRGVRRMAPRIVRVEDSTPLRCLAVIRWDHLLADGTVHSSSVARYVVRRGVLSGRATVELVEYIDAGPVRLEDILHPLAAE